MERKYEKASDRDLRDLEARAIRIGGNEGRVLQNDVDRERRARQNDDVDPGRGKITRRQARSNAKADKDRERLRKRNERRDRWGPFG